MAARIPKALMGMMEEKAFARKATAVVLDVTAIALLDLLHV